MYHIHKIKNPNTLIMNCKIAYLPSHKLIHVSYFIWQLQIPAMKGYRKCELTLGLDTQPSIGGARRFRQYKLFFVLWLFIN